jgi:hypothetical protein
MMAEIIGRQHGDRFMARGNPVVIATRSFATQSEAKEFFKEMLNRYRPGDTVEEGDSLDLAAVLERHPEYAQKLGCGIERFEVMMTDHCTQCFRIIREDGTETDVSYLSCVTGKPPTQKQEVSKAFRRVVRVDLFRARDRFFAEHKDANGLVVCAETGERIRRDDGHMDHRAPMTFEVIVMTFLSGQGLAIEAVPISYGRDEQVDPEIADKALADKFRRYHAGLAKLDFVKSDVHLSKAPSHRLTPTRISLSGAR